ncbi:MAG TPA: trypsin-like peptidase domain-containing protein [Polyangiaceae bacterium]|nr:trypsin-like peptidase domain-containing protein [Polyangiaceae bacterium]
MSARRRGLLAVALVVAGCRARSVRSDEATPAHSGAASAAPSVYAEGSAEPPPVALAPSTFADLAARADPAVVFIETEQAMYGRGKRIVAGGVGTGFVFDPSGLILTNDHVVANATRIDVVFGEDERKRATVIGSDTPTDVAVLRIEGHNMKCLPLGDSDRIRVGDWVVAIGNPFSLSHTVSAGILSAKGRTKSDVKGLDPSGYYDYLQTDASINPGNSGGPLLDLTGRVIGINTAIKPEANSIGFAIPMNMIRELLPTLIEHGKVARSAMGVWVASVKDEDMSRLSLSNKSGSLVTRVNTGSPGAQAGLAVDDVILSFESTTSVSPNRLRWLTSIAGIGKKVRLKVLRGQKILYPTVVLSPAAEPDEGGGHGHGKDER